MNEVSIAMWVAAGIAMISLTWLCYPFLIFPAILMILGKRIQRRLATTWFEAPKGENNPRSAAVLFCAYNEESVIREKLQNLVSCIAQSSIPTKIYVFLDGCTDKSEDIARSFGSAVEVFASPERRGKSYGMRTLVAECIEDILIFTDANVLFSKSLIEDAVGLFRADPSLGCVAGSSAFTNESASANARIEGKYWRLETLLKTIESSAGSCLCGTGAIFAIRRPLFVPPPDDIIDDFHTTLNILFQRRRVIQSDRLMVFEPAATKTKDEWKRKVRITCRAYNCYRYLKKDVERLPLALAFIFYSHKWIRWFSAIPLALFALSGLVFLFLLLPSAGLAVSALLATSLALGCANVRPFSEGLGVVQAFFATLWGVVLSWRGQRFVTWTPVASTRPPVDVSSTASDSKLGRTQ